MSGCINPNAKIYVAGHQGLVGSALMRSLQSNNYTNLVIRTFQELDLRDVYKVDQFFASEKPDYVFIAAAKVGGILANSTYPADFIYDNVMIATNLIHASYKHDVKKLLYLGSSCIYPRMCPQPMKEEYLLTSELEPTNEPYALAKIVGLKMCQAYNKQYGTRFISAMPTNLYGPGDTFDKNNSHVIPALITKFHEAKMLKKNAVTIWGGGTARREFLFVDDLAQALIFLMNSYDEHQWINIGTGQDITIATLARTIQQIVGFEGELLFDATKLEGVPQKLLDVERISNLGWKASTPLESGLKKTYEWYKSQVL